MIKIENETKLARVSGRGSKRSVWFAILLVLIVLFALPFILPAYWVTFVIEMLILGLAGLAANLLLGYGGALTFGHAAYYATGAYATAILLKQATIPFGAVLVISPLIATGVGVIFGAVCSKVYRFYFAIITLAFSMIVWTIIRRWTDFTGGDNGLVSVPVPVFLGEVNNTYFFILGIVLLCTFILWLIVNSPFGWVLRAIRENPERVLFTGTNVYFHRYLAFIISSFFAGVAGVLFVIYYHGAFPDFAYWTKSGDMVMICILGGMSSFFGPIIGAIIWSVLHSVLSSMTEYWLIPLGVIICAVVILLPGGAMEIWGKARLLMSRVIPHGLDKKAQ